MGGQWVVGGEYGVSSEGVVGGEYGVGGEGFVGGKWVVGCSAGVEGVIEGLVNCAVFCLCKRKVFHDHYINLASFPGPAQLSITPSMVKWGEHGMFSYVSIT